MTPPEISGTRKAALLLVQLGTQRAARVLQALDDPEIEAVVGEVAGLDDVQEDLMNRVMTEFVESAASPVPVAPDGQSFARDILNAGLGPERAAAMIERIGGNNGPLFSCLNGLDTDQAVALLSEEHPQALAVILRTLSPERALRIMSRLPSELQGDVAYRMATSNPAPPELLAQVDAGLRRRIEAASTTGRTRPQPDPLDQLVQLLNGADSDTETSILERLTALDEKLAGDVRQRLFTFEDLVRLEDKDLQLLLRELDDKVTALALKGASDGVRQRIFANLSERAAANLAEEVELLGPQRKADVEGARSEVIAATRRLEEAGSLKLARGNDSYVE